MLSIAILPVVIIRAAKCVTVLQRIAVCCSCRRAAAYCSVLQCVAVCCSVLQVCVAVCCSVLQLTEKSLCIICKKKPIEWQRLAWGGFD